MVLQFSSSLKYTTFNMNWRSPCVLLGYSKALISTWTKSWLLWTFFPVMTLTRSAKITQNFLLGLPSFCHGKTIPFLQTGWGTKFCSWLCIISFYFPAYVHVKCGGFPPPPFQPVMNSKWFSNPRALLPVQCIWKDDKIPYGNSDLETLIII